MSVKRYLAAVAEIVGGAIRKFGRDDPVRLAGTTAYFVIFSVAPILIIITAVLGFVIDEGAVSDRLYEELDALVGAEGGAVIRNLVRNFQETERGRTGTIIGVGVFIFAATTFFGVLQRNLNFIWRVRSKPKNNLLKMLRDRLLSFGLILSLGFILLVSLLIDAALAFLRDILTRFIADYALFLIEPINFVVSFGIVTLIFALIFKFLPDVKIRWSVTWVGALITAALFTIGKYLIGFALARTNYDVMYGAAGSIVMLIVWVFYSSMILYFGAEVTEQYALYFEHDIEPQNHAVRIRITDVMETDEAD